ncbi:hypothetical protein [Lysinibacillus xylanilyticus]|uniref:Uncharacterized protein n=1 Tax=Lysinibacillus xylanilyticus TaxID=582475 RepID=A0ABT4EP54_9BACI|nr:hypothetical protein [Lysinibacillus xylanilyticus]MCY9546798.1 hypothetical protein [Lysinibacillus xylanilyticus]
MKRIKYIPKQDLINKNDVIFAITDREGYLLAHIEVNGNIELFADVDVFVNGISAREAIAYDKQ